MDALLQRTPLATAGWEHRSAPGQNEREERSQGNPGSFETLNVTANTDPVNKGDKDSLSQNSKFYTNIAKLCPQGIAEQHIERSEL